jgi:hypothetical protein
LRGAGTGLGAERSRIILLDLEPQLDTAPALQYSDFELGKIAKIEHSIKSVEFSHLHVEYRKLYDVLQSNRFFMMKKITSALVLTF